MPGTAEGPQQDGRRHSHSKSTHAARWQPTADEKADLVAIDAAVTRMRSLTAPDPYVLTIPQDVEPRYHHSYRSQAQQWLHNTPFLPTEHESLQYQTFFYHEHGKHMYVLQNSRPQESRVNVAGDVRPQPGTGANTPITGPKKKITLDAYKKKQNGGATTPDTTAAPASTKASDATAAKQSALKGPIERVKAETEEMLAAVGDPEPADSPVQKKEARTEKKELKRKRDEHATTNIKGEKEVKLERPVEGHIKAEEPATKKVRRTPSPANIKIKQSKTHLPATNPAKTQHKEEYDETKLPPRLSPRLSPPPSPRLPSGMPPRLSPLRPPRSPRHHNAETASSLPSMLSPTLPENISNTLKARDLFHAGSKEEGTIKKVEESGKRKSPVPRNGFRAHSSSPAVRSDAEEKPRPLPSFATKRPPKHESSSSQDEDADGMKQSKANKPHSARMVVKLKYKKPQREGIMRILRMRPTASKRPFLPSPASKSIKDDGIEGGFGKALERENKDRQDDKAAKGVASKLVPTKKERKSTNPEEKAANPGKRALSKEDQTEPPNKRRETHSSDARKEPSTPARSDLRSPVASGTQKTILPATPTSRKERLSHPMKREFSQDSTTTHTPSAISGTPSTNGHTSQPNGTARPTYSSKTPKQQAWEIEQRRLEALGRELKHAASAHLNALLADHPPDPSTSSIEQKLAAVKSLESLLCYLLAFTCTDEAALSADPKQALHIKPWRSLQGFYKFVRRNCDAFPPLYGLVSGLGVAFNAHILTIATQYPSAIEPPDAEALLHTAATMQRAATDAESRLDIDALQLAFPRTWSQRSKTVQLDPSPEAPDPAKLLTGPFRLPLGIVTPPFRAARAGYAMLREWVERDGLEHSFKLKL